MLDRIKSDLQRMFELHGRTALLIGEDNVVKNALGEIISCTPTETPQILVERNQSRGVNNEEIVTLPEDILEFIALSDTFIVESSILKIDDRLFEVRELRPRRIFGQVVCYIGRAERADGVE